MLAATAGTALLAFIIGVIGVRRQETCFAFITLAFQMFAWGWITRRPTPRLLEAKSDKLA